MYTLSEIIAMSEVEAPPEPHPLATQDQIIPPNTTLEAEKQLKRREIDMARLIDPLVMALMQRLGMPKTRSGLEEQTSGW